MKNQFITIIFLLLTTISLKAQNTNVRAQGNYYSAKKYFQSNNYQEALNYVNKSKTALAGSNRELQYLHILAAFNLYKYEEAAKELQTYFDMEEKKIKIVYFDKSVDRLTNDETKALSMLIDPILESADHIKNNPCKRCHGNGKVAKKDDCTSCEGNGFLKDACKLYYCKSGKIDCGCSGCNNQGKSACISGKHDYSSGDMLFGTYRQWKSRCNKCNVNGEINCSSCNGLAYTKKACYSCNNTGKTESTSEVVTCNQCYGKGF